MNTKALGRIEVKNEDRGEVVAIFSRFNVIDSDGDVTLPGAFADGAYVKISTYGHTSWEGVLPVGKGRIRQTSTEALLEGRFFLDTAGGRDTFTVVKELGELGEWSYGYDVDRSRPGEFKGQRVRFLEKLTVHEVSPVLRGAGVRTMTLAAKRRARADDATEAGRKEFLRFVAMQAGVPCGDATEHERLLFIRSLVEGA